MSSATFTLFLRWSAAFSLPVCPPGQVCRRPPGGDGGDGCVYRRRSHGPANIVVSTVEDIVALVTSVLAVLVPFILVLVLLIAVMAIAWWLLNQQRARQMRA